MKKITAAALLMFWGPLSVMAGPRGVARTNSAPRCLSPFISLQAPALQAAFHHQRPADSAKTNYSQSALAHQELTVAVTTFSEYRSKGPVGGVFSNLYVPNAAGLIAALTPYVTTIPFSAVDIDAPFLVVDYNTATGSTTPIALVFYQKSRIPLADIEPDPTIHGNDLQSILYAAGFDDANLSLRPGFDLSATENPQALSMLRRSLTAIKIGAVDKYYYVPLAGPARLQAWLATITDQITRPAEFPEIALKPTADITLKSLFLEGDKGYTAPWTNPLTGDYSAQYPHLPGNFILELTKMPEVETLSKIQDTRVALEIIRSLRQIGISRFSEVYLKTIESLLGIYHLKTATYIMWKDGIIAAVLIARLNPEGSKNVWTIDYVEVMPGFRGNGFGAKLFRAFVDDFREEWMKGNFQYQGGEGPAFDAWVALSRSLKFIYCLDTNSSAVYRRPTPRLLNSESLSQSI
ncbi:MAG: N-acetyltransferase [Candidatus Omnitrophica bacterium]|nr:N-acetyltransferase [Candidatus Omnitrophota bacterium]